MKNCERKEAQGRIDPFIPLRPSILHETVYKTPIYRSCSCIVFCMSSDTKVLIFLLCDAHSPHIVELLREPFMSRELRS
jgi:hypothetical protein